MQRRCTGQKNVQIFRVLSATRIKNAFASFGNFSFSLLFFPGPYWKIAGERATRIQEWDKDATGYRQTKKYTAEYYRKLVGSWLAPTVLLVRVEPNRCDRKFPKKLYCCCNSSSGCMLIVNLPRVAIYAIWLAKGYFTSGAINPESFQATEYPLAGRMNLNPSKHSIRVGRIKLEPPQATTSKHWPSHSVVCCTRIYSVLAEKN